MTTRIQETTGTESREPRRSRILNSAGLIPGLGIKEGPTLRPAAVVSPVAVGNRLQWFHLLQWKTGWHVSTIQHPGETDLWQVNLFGNCKDITLEKRVKYSFSVVLLTKLS